MDDAPHIRQAFEMAAHTDLPLNEILLRLRKRGFRYGTSTVFELMRRPIYKGMIEIAAWRDEPASVVKGIHEPIVPAELWDRVQQVRFEAPSLPKPAKARGGIQAAYPVRGQLACPACSTSDSLSVVTASPSRGNGTRGEVPEAKLLRADEMFFDGTLEADSYNRLKAKLKDEKDRARRSFELAEAGGGEASVTSENLRNAADLMELLPLAWSRAMRLGDVEAADDHIGSVAPGTIAVEGSTVRTIGTGAESSSVSLKNQNADPEEGPASGLVAGARFELTIFGL